ncbi:MAG: helix-turn-helix transcriptional regulator [bacterium]
MRKIVIVDKRSAKLKKLAITLEEFNKDVTSEEWKIIEAEKKYYEVAVALRRKRNKLGLTQDKLAKMAKIPRATIAKVESGARNATLRTLMAMAESMGGRLEIRLG